jgi:hypothetical protein
MVMYVMVMHMLGRLLYIGFASINHIKVGHHARSMVFQNVTVIHPGARPVIGYPRNLNFCSWFYIISILPRSVLRLLAVLINDLEEKPM